MRNTNLGSVRSTDLEIMKSSNVGGMRSTGLGRFVRSTHVHLSCFYSAFPVSLSVLAKRKFRRQIMK